MTGKSRSRRKMVIRLGMVVGEFNSEITERMLRQALKRSAELRALTTYVCKVPGSYDMPLIIKALLEKNDVDAVVTLGAIVKGETKHDEVIAESLVGRITELSLQFGKPVTLGVSGPAVSWDQALARAEEYAGRGVDAAVKMTLRHRKVRRRHGSPSYPVVIE